MALTSIAAFGLQTPFFQRLGLQTPFSNVRPFFQRGTNVIADGLLLTVQSSRGSKRVELLRRIRIGMTRDQVVAALGAPADTGGTSRKYKTPAIYKYGDVELHFEPWKTGRLVRAYIEDAQGNGRTLLE